MAYFHLTPARLAYLCWNYLLHHHKPFLASFKITYRCNLNCLQCPFKIMLTPDPAWEQAVTILDQLYQRGNRMVVFEGGEPTLWHDGQKSIDNLIDYANKLFYSTGVTTNGCQPLPRHVKVLWVSLDGFRDTHNALRGAPVFDIILQNMENCDHPRLFAHITVNSINAPEIPALIQFLKNRVKGITIQFYYPYNHLDRLYLQQDRRVALLNELVSMKKSGYPILNSIPALNALRHNRWRCDDHLIDNANPDGSFSQGCYLKGRSDIDCSRCGFSPHTEISLACQGNFHAIRAGFQIFY